MTKEITDTKVLYRLDEFLQPNVRLAILDDEYLEKGETLMRVLSHKSSLHPSEVPHWLGEPGYEEDTEKWLTTRAAENVEVCFKSGESVDMTVVVVILEILKLVSARGKEEKRNFNVY